MQEPCKCGCGMPVGQGRDYVNTNHKQRAYRARCRNQRRALSKYISGELFALLGEDTATQVCNYLNEVSGDKYNYAIDKAMAIMVTEIRKAKKAIQSDK